MEVSLVGDFDLEEVRCAVCGVRCGLLARKNMIVVDLSLRNP